MNREVDSGFIVLSSGSARGLAHYAAAQGLMARAADSNWRTTP